MKLCNRILRHTVLGMDGIFYAVNFWAFCRSSLQNVISQILSGEKSLQQTGKRRTMHCLNTHDMTGAYGVKSVVQVYEVDLQLVLNYYR